MGKTISNPDDKRRTMLETPIPKLVCSLAVPTIISMLITSIYNMADTFFVGKINTSATGAVGVVFSLMSIIQALGFFFGHGSGNNMSRMLGADRTDDAKKIASTGFFLCLMCGIVLAVVGNCFAEPLARFLGSTDTILPYAVSYLRIILIGTPYMMASLVLNNHLRFQGSAFYAMIGIGFGGVLNIALDPLFIFVFDMGIAGAALATILSQFISFCILLVEACRKEHVGIHISKFTLKEHTLSNIFKGGIPSLARQGLGSISTICLNLAAGPYGDAAIAAMSIVSRITYFAFSAVIGFGQGFQPVCGYNYGANRKDRVREAYLFCVKVSTIVLLVFAVLGLIFSPQLITIFRKNDADVIRIGTLALRFQCISLPLLGLITMTNMLLQTIGRPLKATVLAMARQGIFFVPLILILPQVLGLLGVQLSQAIADVLSFALAIPLAVSELKLWKEAQPPV